MEPRTEIELIQQVGAWADKNFGRKRGADFGMIEEIGEAAHCILKRRQGIRGFEKESFFIEQLADALSDAIIYLADYCYLHKCFFQINRNQHPLTVTPDDERRVFAHLLQAASTLMSLEEVMPMSNEQIPAAELGIYNSVAQRVCTGVECLASIYKIDIRMAVTKTWAKVGKRDWVANPAAPLAEQV